MSFIFTLLDSKVDFRALDLPDMNTMTVGIFASYAQYERERIGKRIKDALAAKRRREERLGYDLNLTAHGRKKDAVMRSTIAARHVNNIQATAMITLIREDGRTNRTIADRLNKLQYTTSTGKKFETITVQRLFQRSKKNK